MPDNDLEIPEFLRRKAQEPLVASDLRSVQQQFKEQTRRAPTRQDVTRLRALGYKSDAIEKMERREAEEIIMRGRMAR